MSPEAGVLIVGASAAGMSVAENLRSEGYAGKITLVGREPYHPYDRPPLSKQLLTGVWADQQMFLRSNEQLEALGCDWKLGIPATSLDVGARVAQLGDGQCLPYDDLVIATGQRARTASVLGEGPVFSLYDFEDLVHLRKAVVRYNDWLVVGGGFLANECVASLRALGLNVTFAFPEDTPLSFHPLSTLGETVSALHAANRVKLLPKRLVSEIDCDAPGQPHKLLVRFENERSVLTDAVVVAIGAVPATDWLADSGLQLDDGIVCDEHCRAGPGIWAAGDVCRWPRGLERTLSRSPSRTNASEQGRCVARNILGANEVYDPIAYGWTDLYGVKFQFYGEFPMRSGVDIQHVHQREPVGGRLVRFAVDGRLRGVLSWSAHRELRMAREEIVRNHEDA